MFGKFACGGMSVADRFPSRVRTKNIASLTVSGGSDSGISMERAA